MARYLSTDFYFVGYSSSASGSLFRRKACSGSRPVSSKDMCGIFLNLKKGGIADRKRELNNHVHIHSTNEENTHTHMSNT